MKAITLVLLALFVAVVASEDYYSTKLAQRMIQISSITYESESSILNWNCSLCKTVSFSHPKVVQNSSNSVFGLIGYSPEYNKIIVAWRGSVDIANWILNFKTTRTSYPLCSGCSVHVGFNQGFNSVKSQVEPLVEFLMEKYPSASIYITGHSLGGALAVMSAAHLHNKYNLVEKLYPLGQPRVGNDAFAQFMTAFIPNTYRIVHYADEVCHLPQSILGFKHSGWEIWYQRGMQSYKICPSESKDCSNQLSLLKMSSSDHSITNYLQIKVESSFLEDLSSFFKFKWLRFMTKDMIFNLDMQTMLEEDRKVREAIKRHH